jgi:hypothetical protein
MTVSSDIVGDLLRTVYGTYGMRDEGPPAGFNVTATIGPCVPEPRSAFFWPWVLLAVVGLQQTYFGQGKGSGVFHPD